MVNFNDIVYLDLFSGAGGFPYGFEKGGIKIKKHYYSEVDKNAIANYKYNFKTAEYVGSVTDVHKWRIERPNIITFGSPCQDFSLAGKGKGLDGSKSSLIKYAIDAVKRLKPDIFIWENVKGAFSTNDSADYWAIIQAFTNIGGYGCEWQLVNTAWFLPQNRERIYLIGHFTGRSIAGVFPIGKTNRLHFKANSEKSGEIASTLNANDNKSWVGNFIVQANTKEGFEIATVGDSINFSNPNCRTRRGRVGKQKAQTLDTQCNQGVIQVNKDKKSGGSQPYQQDRVYDANGISPALMRELSDLIVRPILTINRQEKRQNGRRMKEHGEPSFTLNTLNTQDQHGVMVNDNIRRLTEIECERLQGFPDDWTKLGIFDGVVKQIPKTQRYKLCGNAVSTVIPEEIARRLIANQKL